MRSVMAIAALAGIIAAPVAPLGAQDYHETKDIYSNNGAAGPSFGRAAHCAAIFAVSLNAVQEGTEDYDLSVQIGSA